MVVSEIISFSDTAERILEVLLVVLVGICLAFYWDWRAVPLALVFFFLIRPAATHLFMFGSPTGTVQRWLMGWFGIRGIGSLYYLAYALNHGLDENKETAVGITLSVVAISVVLHGLSTQPIIDRYEKAIEKREKIKKKNETEENEI